MVEGTFLYVNTIVRKNSKTVCRPAGSSRLDPRYTSKVVKYSFSVLVWDVFFCGEHGAGDLFYTTEHNNTRGELSRCAGGLYAPVFRPPPTKRHVLTLQWTSPQVQNGLGRFGRGWLACHHMPRLLNWSQPGWKCPCIHKEWTLGHEHKSAVADVCHPGGVAKDRSLLLQ